MARYTAGEIGIRALSLSALDLAVSLESGARVTEVEDEDGSIHVIDEDSEDFKAGRVAARAEADGKEWAKRFFDKQ